MLSVRWTTKPSAGGVWSNFRYGKSPNCLRVYDKPAECKARLPQILKRVSPDAEIPTFEDLFGFPENATLTRVERQAGAGRFPADFTKFGHLRKADELDPFPNVEVLRTEIPFPDPARVGVSRALKIAGVRAFIDRYGLQQARALLNAKRNAKRIFDDLDWYISGERASTEFTRDSIVQSYRSSVQAQVDGSIERRRRYVPESKSGFEFPKVLRAC